MSDTIPRVVYDCNIYAQALLNINGPGGSCVRRALSRKVSLFISERILSEIRELPFKSTPSRLGVTVARTDLLIQNILSVGELVTTIPSRFTYSRDPDDAHYVDLALARDANLVVSRDKDLLDLMNANLKDGKDFQSRFPTLRILDPVVFLRELDGSAKSEG
jgi:putative PIN family toxin of toxin-antitoxin system